MEEKNLKKYPEYSIGLDIGTNSVGWAVTDSENNILKHGGKNMWGARLFDEGDTAAQTRMFRGTRRRIERRRERVNILHFLNPLILKKQTFTFTYYHKKGIYSIFLSHLTNQ